MNYLCFDCFLKPFTGGATDALQRDALAPCSPRRPGAANTGLACASCGTPIEIDTHFRRWYAGTAALAR
jgi:hypothetical protein